jgi:hypothetical protein
VVIGPHLKTGNFKEVDEFFDTSRCTEESKTSSLKKNAVLLAGLAF